MKRERLQDLMLDDLYGELPPAERAAYEAGLQAHPDLRAELEANRRTLGAVRSLAEAEAPAALPETHIQAILRQARMAAAGRAEAPRRTFWARLGSFLLQPAATAAMLVLVVAGTGLHLLSYRSTQNTEQFDAAERVPPRPAAESAAPAVASTATPAPAPERGAPNQTPSAAAALPAAPAVVATLDDGVAASMETSGQPLNAKQGVIDDGRVARTEATETAARVARVAPDPVPVRLLGDEDFARRTPVRPSAEGDNRHTAAEENARDRLAASLDDSTGSAAALGRGTVGAANEAMAGGAHDEFGDRERSRGERRVGEGGDASVATTRSATDAPEAALPQLGWSDPLAGESIGDEPASAVQENRRAGQMQLASPRGDLAPAAPPSGDGRGSARPPAEPAVFASGESAPQAVVVAPAAPASPPKVAGGAVAGPAVAGAGSAKASESVAQSLAPAAPRPAGAAPPAAYRPFDSERTVQSRPPAGNEPLLERGLDELQAGRFNEAIVALNQALARGPAPQVAAEARLRLAEAYRKTGQAGRALAEYQAIVSRGGAPQAAVEARLEAARLLLAEGRLDQAEAQLRPIVGDPRRGQAARDLLGSIARLRAQAPAKQYGPERSLPRAGKKRNADEREVLPLDDQPPTRAEPARPPAPTPSQPAK